MSIVHLPAVAADPRRVVEKNSVTIMNVTNNDAFVIQCNATNKHGYIWANAYLNVQSQLLRWFYDLLQLKTNWFVEC